jgi:hypothetical protein
MMKLAEALILRADLQKRVQQLRERLVRSARVQEGDPSPENPTELLVELESVLGHMTDLIKRINRTNARTPFPDGQTLTDALADRDRLALERSVLSGVIQAATGEQQASMYGAYRMTRSEIKFVSTIDIAATQRRVDDLARRHRELDTRIQAMNWAIDLME